MASPRDDSRPAPIPGVLAEDERLAVERRFGVGPEQVIRDHAISKMLSPGGFAAATVRAALDAL